MRRRFSTILLIVFLLIGIGLLLYPSLSNYWNSFHQSQAISNYDEQVSVLDTTEYDAMWSAADRYNSEISRRRNLFVLDDEESASYYSLLDLGNNGIMGYITIPSIEVSLPIYHGTDEAILQIGVGHLDWSSLPVGGENNHCVLSGHRGLPGSKLFTSLDQLSEGDVFHLYVLNRTLTYQIDNISIVEPQETKNLRIEEGKDLCTLVTCTPYGVNTHRLLVRGHRIENTEEAPVTRVTADALTIDPIIIASVIVTPMLLVLFCVLLLSKQRDDYYSYED